MIPEQGAVLDIALSKLVYAALSRTDLSALRNMLLTLAQECGAYGCSLWQVQPLQGTSEIPLHPVSNPPDRPLVIQAESKIFVLADGLPDNLICAYHNVPYGLSSATGTAMEEGFVNIPNIYADKRVGIDRSNFLRRAGVRSLCSVRIDMDDSTPGAVTLYGKDEGLFREDQIRILRFLSHHVPYLYRTIRDRASYRLAESVADSLQGLEKTKSPTLGDVQQQLTQVCRDVSKSLQCLETSIYFLNHLEWPGELRLMATTRQDFIRKEIYSPDDTGLTSWVWKNAKQIEVFDLSAFDQSVFPGLDWKDEFDIVKYTRRALGLPPDEEVPPVSFMAVPIMVGDALLGVIRCCAAKAGPYYFAEREIGLLRLIASRIGHYWHNAMRREEMTREIESWSMFVQGINDLNRSMQSSATRGDSEHRPLLQSALEVLQRALPTADILDISIIDPASRTVSPTSFVGAAWLSGGEAAVADRHRTLNFRVDDKPPTSPAAELFQTRKKFVSAPDISEGSRYYTPAFPTTRQAIFFAIRSTSTFHGVLSVRSLSAAPFPRHTEAVLELLCQQIGSYLQLARAMRQQAQTYSDFQHQLRSPVFQAHKRMLLVENAQQDFNLDAIRGLLGKARRVVTNLRLYADLVAGNPIRVSPDPVSLTSLVKPLIEAASDNQVLWLHRKIVFQVERESFAPKLSLQVDSDLFNEMANDILDNAGKYSHRSTIVSISALRYATGKLAICFRNFGLHLTEGDAANAAKRGWRGRLARSRAGEGSGIGLWIVDNIMDAHGGKLEIVHTDEHGQTEIRLVFPLLG